MQVNRASVTVSITAAEVLAVLKPTLERQFQNLGKITGADVADGDLTVTLTFAPHAEEVAATVTEEPGTVIV